MRANHLALNAVMLAGILALAAGCRTPSTVDNKQPPGTPQVVEDDRVVPDTMLARKIQLVQVKEVRTAAGLLQIQAELFNKSNRSEDVNYRFEWVDQDGLIIDTILSRWSRLTLTVGESVMVRALAPTPNAVDFRLKLVRPSN